MEEFYDIKRIDKDVDSLSNLDAIVVIHPKSFLKKRFKLLTSICSRGGASWFSQIPIAFRTGFPVCTGPLQVLPEVVFKSS